MTATLVPTMEPRGLELPAGVQPGLLSRVDVFAPDHGPGWNLEEMRGRLVELRGTTSSSFAMELVRDAQAKGEPAAWLTDREEAFYPPDAAATGIDLEALIVVRVPRLRDVALAADRLLRSGAVGLAVLDLTGARRVPLVVPTRLAGLARHHEAAVVCLTHARAASLGSLVSLRCETQRGTLGDDGEVPGSIHVTKDRRRGRRWTHEEVFLAPDGLC